MRTHVWLSDKPMMREWSAEAARLILFIQRKAREDWDGCCRGEYGCLDDVENWIAEYYEGA